MDINTLGFVIHAGSADEESSPFVIQMMIFRENSPYYISLGIGEKDHDGDEKSVFLRTDQARDLGEKLIFLADLAEPRNVESKQ